MTLNCLYQDDLVFTGYNAGVTSINAGELVAAYNNQDAVTSKANLADSDIQIQTMNTLTEYTCVGIAMEKIGTATVTTEPPYGAVGTRGLFILRAGALSTSGWWITPIGGPDPAEVRTLYEINASASWVIGRALTGATAADAYMVCILDIA